MFEYEFVEPGELEVFDRSKSEVPCGFEFCYPNVEFCWFGQLVACQEEEICYDYWGYPIPCVDVE